MARLWKYHQLPVDPSVVLYEVSDGDGLLDNPRAIFEYLISRNEFGHLKHVWVLSAEEMPRWLSSSWARDTRVTLVQYKSEQYFRHLATAKYLINSATFPREFCKRTDQVYVNTWHGIPLKHMGYDMPNGPRVAQNIMRNFMAADYLVSANDFMTETLYRSAYRMDGIFQGSVLETGQPRVDRQFEITRDEARAILMEAGVRVDGLKTILYAPTWRGSNIRRPDFEADNLVALHEALQEIAEPAGYRVLFKVHRFTKAQAEEDERLREFVVPNHMETNRVLAAADLLITDYSSIFFDYLGLDRPIVFYAPDIEDYKTSRGLYLDVSELPGEVVSTLDGLKKTLKSVLGGDDRFRTKRSEWRKRFCQHDDGRATERLVDAVFRAKSSSPELVRSLRNDKTSLLIYAGGLLANGITNALIALLNSLDYNRYDVCLFYSSGGPSSRAKALARVHPAVRHFPRLGYMIQLREHEEQRVIIETAGLDAAPGIIEQQSENFEREARRCFGDAQFDCVVDFSGYSPFWAFYCLHVPGSRKVVWMHNDLASEAANPDKPQHHVPLSALFTMYREFDNIACVSSALERVNAEKLEMYAPRDKFITVRNLLDFKKLLERAGGSASAKAARHAEVTVDTSSGLDAQIGALLDAYGWNELSVTLARQRLIRELFPDGSDAKTFVAVGRLSPEKNHERLIRAFAKVHGSYPKTRLLICGEGVLRDHLQLLIESLELSAVCRLAGHVDAVAAVIRRADCFVLSSDYEGQPIVLLEAATLGKPIITTRFESVEGALPPGLMHVVDARVDALACGMVEYLKGNVRAPVFDPATYTKGALAEFHAAATGVGLAVARSPIKHPREDDVRV